jgi:short-subunit dehydrogenase
MSEHGDAVTIITGASAGIGADLARVFARHGHRLVLVARREDRLLALANEIAATGAARPGVLALDLARADAPDRLAVYLESGNLDPEYVVNNAGFGLIGKAAELDRASQLRMIDLNVRTLTDLSLCFSESLIRRRGGILNVASVAGFLPGPNMAVYYATKAYVLSFSEALHRELRGKGVRVTALCPGPVPTEFQAVAGIREGTQPRLLEKSSLAVAEAGYRGLMAGRRIVVPGGMNKAITMMLRFFPRRLVLEGAYARQRNRAP